MKVLPIGLVLEGRLSVVVGGGPVAARKARSLIEAGSRVRVVAARFSEDFDEVGPIERIEAAYEPRFLEGATVAIAATDDSSVNSAVARNARAAGVLVNVVDTPDECDFIFPAVSRRGDVSVAVSTGGASPLLAKRLKEKVDASVGDVYGQLAAVLGAVRRRAIDALPDPKRRSAFFEGLASDEFLEYIGERGRDEAISEALRRLDQQANASREAEE